MSEPRVVMVGNNVLLTPEGAQHLERVERESRQFPKLGMAVSASATAATLAGDPNWLWAILWVGWFAVEGIALAIAGDRLQPNSYWIRKAPRWVRGAGVAGLCAFLVQHFVFCGDLCA